MKIFATGDTHGNFERFRPEYFPEGQELTKEDVVLQLGDFGGVWFGDERDDEALDWLEGLPFTVAFVSGNHENYDALARYPVETWHGGRVQPIRPHVLHLMRGRCLNWPGSPSSPWAGRPPTISRTGSSAWMTPALSGNTGY